MYNLVLALVIINKVMFVVACQKNEKTEMLRVANKSGEEKFKLFDNVELLYSEDCQSCEPVRLYISFCKSYR